MSESLEDNKNLSKLQNINSAKDNQTVLVKNLNTGNTQQSKLVKQDSSQNSFYILQLKPGSIQQSYPNRQNQSQRFQNLKQQQNKPNPYQNQIIEQRMKLDEQLQDELKASNKYFSQFQTILQGNENQLRKIYDYKVLQHIQGNIKNSKRKFFNLHQKNLFQKLLFQRKKVVNGLYKQGKNIVQIFQQEYKKEKENYPKPQNKIEFQNYPNQSFKILFQKHVFNRIEAELLNKLENQQNRQDQANNSQSLDYWRIKVIEQNFLLQNKNKLIDQTNLYFFKYENICQNHSNPWKDFRSNEFCFKILQKFVKQNQDEVLKITKSSFMLFIQLGQIYNTLLEQFLLYDEECSKKIELQMLKSDFQNICIQILLIKWITRNSSTTISQIQKKVNLYKKKI